MDAPPKLDEFFKVPRRAAGSDSVYPVCERHISIHPEIDDDFALSKESMYMAGQVVV